MGAIYFALHEIHFLLKQFVGFLLRVFVAITKYALK